MYKSKVSQGKTSKSQGMALIAVGAYWSDRREPAGPSSRFNTRKNKMEAFTE